MNQKNIVLLILIIGFIIIVIMIQIPKELVI